jgi:lipoate-protein ligase B
MVYPILRLRGGLVAYLEAVAGALAELATQLGVPGAVWKRDPAGLWLGDAKLAACGVHLHRRVTTHGFALDVATPRDAWTMINPCGLSGVRTTSIAAECAARGIVAPPPMAEVARCAGPILCRVLDSMRAVGLPSHDPAVEFDQS